MILKKKSNSPSRPSVNGFSLAEVMIAMSLLSIVATMCFSILHFAFAIWNTSKSQQSVLQQGEMALKQIYHDLKSAYVRQNVERWMKADSLKLDQRSPKSPRKNYFLGMSGTAEKSSSAFHFIRLGHRGPAEIGYWIDNDRSNPRLLRRYNPVARGDIEQGEEGDMETHTTLLDNVDSLVARYLFEGIWYPDWPPKKYKDKCKNSLPEAVEITLSVLQQGEVLTLPVLWIHLPLGGKNDDFEVPKK